MVILPPPGFHNIKNRQFAEAAMGRAVDVMAQTRVQVSGNITNVAPTIISLQRSTRDAITLLLFSLQAGTTEGVSLPGSIVIDNRHCVNRASRM